MSNRANTCPCCGGFVLRHIRHSELYWFCPSCRQEVPLLTISRIPGQLESAHATSIKSSSVTSLE